MSKAIEAESNTTIILPTLNEASNIGAMIETLRELYPQVKILVADDASTDETQHIVNSISQTHPSNVSLLARENVEWRGITASVMDAVQNVDSDYFLVMDADMQHPPSVVKAFFQEIELGMEFVVGARLPYKEKQGWHRVLATRVSTWAALIVLRLRGIKVGDPMSGLFAAKTNLVKPIIAEHAKRFEPEGYKVLFDILRVISPVPEISQVWYDFGLRQGGKSKLRVAHAWFFLKSLWK